jgi:cyclophilin family peptidyl-prolyl cis-trans isomerase
MATDKRARKRTAREERLEAERRRRNARLIAIGGVILALVVFAIFTAGGDEGGNEGGGGNETEEAAAEAACGADVPEEANPQQYEAPPEMQLEDGVDYSATIVTSCGEIEVDLLEEEAPVTVNNFVFLAREGYFDGLIWHRVERNFVIQAGDPDGNNGQPPDGPGYEIEDELWAKSKDYVWGTLAMANAGPNTGGSQFFIIVAEPRDKPAGLQALYSVFGTVAPDSYGTLEEIATAETPGGGDPSQASKPVVPIFIETIEIAES